MKKKHQQRRLTTNNLAILNFLWRWKVANSPTLKTFHSPEIPYWTFYHRIQKLRNEGFIKLAGQGELFNSSVWHLTKKGFEAIEGDLGEIAEKRYLPHSIPHDAWVLAFQMGNHVHGIPSGVAFFSEQQFRTTHESLLPDWLPADKSHIPDGFTYVGNGKQKTLFGIEVELHLKPIERYDDISTYYDRQEKVDQVLWLARSEYMVAKILGRFKATECFRAGIHSFVLLEDFKQNGWNSKARFGPLKDRTVSELMLATAQQPRGNHAATVQKPELTEIFLSPSRSPKIHAR